MAHDRPIDLLNNLKQLIELDAFFEVQALPRASAGTASPRPAAQPAASTSPEPSTPAKPGPSADHQPKIDQQQTTAPHPLQATTLPAEPAAALAAIEQQISACQHCGLCQQRQRSVPGEGQRNPDILFIGEGPGADEDRQGRPFVGAAGQLLDKMIRGMGYQREQVYIANIVKCRPPGNRAPEPEEIAACLPYLEAQVDALQPKVICTLGNTPLRALTDNPRAGITRQRGQAFTWRGLTCIPTFHPSYLLRNEAAKKPAWEDLKLVLAELGREPPRR